MNTVMRLLGALSLALSLCSCVSVRTAAIDPGPTAVRVDGNAWISAPDGSFGVRVPDGWKLQQDRGGESIQLTLAADPKRGLMIVRSFPTSITPTAAAIAQVEEGVLEGLKQQTTSFELDGRRHLRVGGNPAFQLRYQCGIKGQPVNGTLTVVVSESGLYSVNMVAPAMTFSRAEDGLKQLLASLRIEPRLASAASYVDPEGAFSVTLPAGWNFQAYLPGPEMHRSFHSFAAADGSDSTLVVSRMVNDTITPSVSRRVIALVEDGMLSRLQARIDRVIDVRPIMLDGRPAVVRQLSLVAGLQSLYLYEVIQVSEHEVTAIVAHGLQPWLEQQRRSIEAFTGSFTFRSAPVERPAAVASR
jgi:hypothetical protein